MDDNTCLFFFFLFFFFFFFFGSNLRSGGVVLPTQQTPSQFYERYSTTFHCLTFYFIACSISNLPLLSSSIVLERLDCPFHILAETADMAFNRLRLPFISLVVLLISFLCYNQSRNLPIFSRSIHDPKQLGATTQIDGFASHEAARSTG